jgi:DNA-binding NtrC family response regulator
MMMMLDIVIYEEDDLMRGLLEEWLTRAGYRVRRGKASGAQTADDADLVIFSMSTKVGQHIPEHP